MERLDFGPIRGRKGDIVMAVARTTGVFRGNRLIAEDSCVGVITTVRQIYAGDYYVFPRGTPEPWWRRLWLWFRRKPVPMGMLTAYFSPDRHGRRFAMPICPPGTPVEIEVEFLNDGEWKGWICG